VNPERFSLNAAGIEPSCISAFEASSKLKFKKLDVGKSGPDHEKPNAVGVTLAQENNRRNNDNPGCADSEDSEGDPKRAMPKATTGMLECTIDCDDGDAPGCTKSGTGTSKLYHAMLDGEGIRPMQT